MEFIATMKEAINMAKKEKAKKPINVNKVSGGVGEQNNDVNVIDEQGKSVRIHGTFSPHRQ